MTTDRGGVFLARLLGAAFIQVGLVSLLARNDANSVSLRAILRGYTGGAAIGLVAMLVGQLSGLLNSVGWGSVAIYLLFTLGYGYFASTASAASFST